MLNGAYTSILTSVAIRVAWQYQSPWCLDSDPLSLCRTAHVRWYSRSLAIQSAMHIFPLNSSPAGCHHHTKIQTRADVRSYTPTCGCISAAMTSAQKKQHSKKKHSNINCVLCLTVSAKLRYVLIKNKHVTKYRMEKCFAIFAIKENFSKFIFVKRNPMEQPQLSGEMWMRKNPQNNHLTKYTSIIQSLRIAKSYYKDAANRPDAHDKCFGTVLWD